MKRSAFIAFAMILIAVVIAKTVGGREDERVDDAVPREAVSNPIAAASPIGIGSAAVPATLIRYEELSEDPGQVSLAGFDVGYISENAYCVKSVNGAYAAELNWIESFCVDKANGKLSYRNGNVSVRNLQPSFAVEHTISAPIPALLRESVQPLAKRLLESDPMFTDRLPIEPRVSAALLDQRLASGVYRFVTREPCGDEACVVVEISDQYYLFNMHEGRSIRQAIRERDGFVHRISTLDSHGAVMRVIVATSIRSVSNGFGDLFAMSDDSKVYTLTIAAMRQAIDPEMESASDRMEEALLALGVVKVGAVEVSGNLYAKKFDYAYPPLPWTSESPALVIETYRNSHGHTIDVVLATPGARTWPFWNDAWFTTRFVHRSIIEMNFEFRDHQSVIVWESNDARCGADMTMLLTSEDGSDILPESAIFQEWKGIVDPMAIALCAKRQD